MSLADVSPFVASAASSLATSAARTAFAANWLGKNLVTYQTDEKGQPVTKILVEDCTDIAQELYLGAVVDRSTRRVVFMASTEGGVEIEKVAAETGEQVPLRVFLHHGPPEYADPFPLSAHAMITTRQ